VLSGLVDREGVQFSYLMHKVAPGNTSGLTSLHGRVYRATRWAVVTLELHNLGQRSWAPGEARLTDAAGRPVKVRSVRMDRPLLEPGEQGTLALEVDPFDPEGAPFQLELVDKEGHRLLPITEVSI
jgi:hypothetical protein